MLFPLQAGWGEQGAKATVEGGYRYPPQEENEEWSDEFS